MFPDEGDRLIVGFVVVVGVVSAVSVCSSSFIPIVLTKADLAIILFIHSWTESPPAGSPSRMVSLTSKWRKRWGIFVFSFAVMVLLLMLSLPLLLSSLGTLIESWWPLVCWRRCKLISPIDEYNLGRGKLLLFSSSQLVVELMLRRRMCLREELCGLGGWNAVVAGKNSNSSATTWQRSERAFEH